MSVIYGHVTSVRDGICMVSGLSRVKAGEIVYISKTDDFLYSADFIGNVDHSAKVICERKNIERLAKFDDKFLRGLVLNLNDGFVGVMVLGNDRLIAQGSLVFRTNNLLKINTSMVFFGHVINSLGDLLDDEDNGELVRMKGDFDFSQLKIVYKRNSDNIRTIILEDADFVEKKATGIIDRVPVRIPLLTGLTAIDSLVPIGRGQRELIIGDRQTGKTSVAIDSILNHVEKNNFYLGQKGLSNVEMSSLNPSNIALEFIEVSLEELRNIVWFVYCGIGQKQSSISSLRLKLKKKDALWFTSIVSATSAESAPLQFLAPYAACTLGEFIRDVVGGDCVVVFDDLSKHAVAYRQMSLLLRRPPGREAFPGDVFYVHSRLLERAGALTNKYFVDDGFIKKYYRGTLTAFPIIETQAGDVSAYIPTNVISITDGQIFLETELFYRGIRPAINVGLSVSRVGSAAQPILMKSISGSLKMELAQFREIEGFAKLGANLDDHTKRLLIRGENLVEVLKQDLHNPLNTFLQSFNIFAGVGFSGKFLMRLQFLKDVFFPSILRFSSVKSNLVFSSKFFNISWLETLRIKSNEFQSTDVRSFLNASLSLIHKIGISEFFNYIGVYDIINLFLIRYPVMFFNDFLTLYFFEYGELKCERFEFNKDLFYGNSIADFFGGRELLNVDFNKEDILSDEFRFSIEAFHIPSISCKVPISKDSKSSFFGNNIELRVNLENSFFIDNFMEDSALKEKAVSFNLLFFKNFHLDIYDIVDSIFSYVNFTQIVGDRILKKFSILFKRMILFNLRVVSPFFFFGKNLFLWNPNYRVFNEQDCYFSNNNLTTGIFSFSDESFEKFSDELWMDLTRGFFEENDFVVFSEILNFYRTNFIIYEVDNIIEVLVNQVEFFFKIL